MTSSDDGRAMTRSGGIAAPDMRKSESSSTVPHDAVDRFEALKARGRRGDARVTGRKPTSPTVAAAAYRSSLRWLDSAESSSSSRRLRPTLCSVDEIGDGPVARSAPLQPAAAVAAETACAKQTPFLLPCSE